MDTRQRFFRVGSSLVAAAALLVACTSNGPQPDNGPPHEEIPTEVAEYPLSVTHHRVVSLSDSRADEVMEDASAVAQRSDGPNDVACSVVLRRHGEVTDYSLGNGFINSRADFVAVLDLPGYVKVVNQINWCGGFGPGILGCAPVPGESLVVVRYNRHLEGILWFHEFGHNRGLHHRNEAHAVMFPSMGGDHLELTTEECNAYLGIGPLVAEAPAETVFEAQTAPADIRDFVRQNYVHGVPFEWAASYDVSAVPELLEMLSDPEEARYWVNVVTVLGLVGDESVADDLIAFIEEGEGTLSLDAYNARTAAIFALGYLANRTGSPQALDYLINGATVENWDQRALAWTSPFQEAPLDRDIQLTQVNIAALALSGREPALAALQELRTAPTRGEFARELSPILDEAIEAHDTIDEGGLSLYAQQVNSGRPD